MRVDTHIPTDNDVQQDELQQAKPAPLVHTVMPRGVPCSMASILDMMRLCGDAVSVPRAVSAMAQDLVGVGHLLSGAVVLRGNGIHLSETRSSSSLSADQRGAVGSGTAAVNGKRVEVTSQRANKPRVPRPGRTLTPACHAGRTRARQHSGGDWVEGCCATNGGLRRWVPHPNPVPSCAREPACLPRRGKLLIAPWPFCRLRPGWAAGRMGLGALIRRSSPSPPAVASQPSLIQTSAHPTARGVGARPSSQPVACARIACQRAWTLLLLLLVSKAKESTRPCRRMSNYTSARPRHDPATRSERSVPHPRLHPKPQNS